MKASTVAKFIITVVVLMFTLALTSCTENNRARVWGGTETIQLEPGIRLVNITWKGEKGATDLWLLTKKDTTAPSVYYFKEKSSLGIMEGKVVIVEK